MANGVAGYAGRSVAGLERMGGQMLFYGRVLKADYQWFSPSKDQNRFNMGLGWSF